MLSAVDNFDVVVVGAGPTGAALAGDLGARGLRVLLVDKTDGVVRDARLHAVNIRTMEIARRWGIEEELRNCGWPLDHPQDVVWGPDLSSAEYARIPWASIGAMTPPPESPTFAQRCPQRWFNPILLNWARRHATVEVLMEWEMVSFEQDENRVLATVSSVNNSTSRTVSAQYLVACDGARSGIRAGLGIKTVRTGMWGHSAEAIIRSPELTALPLTSTAGRFTVVDKEGRGISLIHFDGKDDYRLTMMVTAGSASDVDLTEAVHTTAGKVVDFEFVSDPLPWSNHESVAERFREGRAFLAGDAAHTMPTTGGYGMNTGILDSIDLAWKLEAAIHGWAGPDLLDTYDTERREAVVRTAGLASSIYRDWVALKDRIASLWPDVDAGGSAAEAAKATLADMLVETFAREFNSLGGALGYRYEQSPICLRDDSESTPDSLDRYYPTARPGHLAPHVWLSAGVSTLDLFGPSFTLVHSISEGGEATAHVLDEFAKTCATRGVPLRIESLDSAEVRELYQTQFVLVRPDGHVAWRGDGIDIDTESIIDIVRGAGVSA